MKPMHGEYRGDHYTVKADPCDPRTHPSRPEFVYRVQRKGHDPHNVLIGNPPDCDCEDFIFARDGITPVPCRHVYAARKIVGEASKVG